MIFFFIELFISPFLQFSFSLHLNYIIKAIQMFIRKVNRLLCIGVGHCAYICHMRSQISHSWHFLWTSFNEIFLTLAIVISLFSRQFRVIIDFYCRLFSCFSMCFFKLFSFPLLKLSLDGILVSGKLVVSPFLHLCFLLLLHQVIKGVKMRVCEFKQLLSIDVVFIHSFSKDVCTFFRFCSSFCIKLGSNEIF